MPSLSHPFAIELPTSDIPPMTVDVIIDNESIIASTILPGSDSPFSSFHIGKLE